MTLQAPALRVVLDPQATTAMPPARKSAMLATLLEQGYAVTAGGVSDVAPLDDSPLGVLAEAADDQGRDEVDPNAGVPVHWRGVAGLDADGVLDVVRQADPSHTPEAAEAAPWKPWFPVIDYDRCTNCMQCLSFCLFGVYDVDEDKKIDVAQPQRCKTNCPACSRVCPEVAILFPKYKNGPINGDQVQDEDIQREKMKTDISSLLGGDIYALLRKRHERATSRFSKERDDARALKERQRCLVKLKEQLDIPDEVLAELPTAEAIRAKAAERIEARDDDLPPEENQP